MAKTFICGIIVEGRPCVMLGDDEEALEKSSTLLDKGAKLTVVGETLSSPEWKALENLGARLVEKKPEAADAKGAYLVFFADKNDDKTAAALRKFCDQNKIFLCAIDQPGYCDVVNVSQYRRGHLLVGISSEGVSPSTAKKIRLGLEDSLKDVPLEEYLDWLARERVRLEKEIPDKKERRKKLIQLVEGFEFTARVKLPEKWGK